MKEWYAIVERFVGVDIEKSPMKPVSLFVRPSPRGVGTEIRDDERPEKRHVLSRHRSR